MITRLNLYCVIRDSNLLRPRFFLVLCLGLFSSSVFTVPGEPAFVIEREIQLDDAASSRRFELDLGDLPAGVSGRVSVTLRNRSLETKRFTEVRATCACIKPGISSKKIEPGKTAVVTLTLSTAGKLNTPSAIVVVRSVGDKDPRNSVDLVVNYRLRGMLAFQQPLYSPKVP